MMMRMMTMMTMKMMMTVLKTKGFFYCGMHSEELLLFCYQEKDLKQYMDDCGGIMSMSNVRVSESFFPVQPS